MKRLGFITQFKIAFLLPIVKKFLEKCLYVYDSYPCFVLTLYFISGKILIFMRVT